MPGSWTHLNPCLGCTDQIGWENTHPAIHTYGSSCIWKCTNESEHRNIKFLFGDCTAWRIDPVFLISCQWICAFKILPNYFFGGFFSCLSCVLFLRFVSSVSMPGCVCAALLVLPGNVLFLCEVSQAGVSLSFSFFNGVWRYKKTKIPQLFND